MTSDCSPHPGRVVADARSRGIPHRSQRGSLSRSATTASMWRVSWFPERPLGRNEATTAMVLAEVVSAIGERHQEHPRWPFIESWAAELGLSGPRAVARISEPTEAEREAGE